jgi:putative transcriptional regulator
MHGVEEDHQANRERAPDQGVRFGSKKEGCDEMSKRAFDKIAAGLNEALAVARGTAKPSKLHVPPEIDVRSIRSKLKLSQDDFAAEFGFTINQIRDWEQGRTRPLGALRAYLMIIKRDPKAVIKLLRSSRVVASRDKAA